MDAGSDTNQAVADPGTRLLMETFQADLRRVARRERRHLGGHFRHNGHGSETFRTTALINEAYLKLFQTDQWHSHAHFLNVAALAMRQVLISHARERLALKRGAGVSMLPVEAADEVLAEEVFAQNEERILALDAALSRLAVHNPRLARVVECRYFSGYTEEETAAALGITDRTVRRDWAKAKALLYESLGGD
jgi:RNA polymerase sigma factor (TIGR02999 family)